jgi:hypothetical protein
MVEHADVDHCGWEVDALSGRRHESVEERDDPVCSPGSHSII